MTWPDRSPAVAVFLIFTVAGCNRDEPAIRARAPSDARGEREFAGSSLLVVTLDTVRRDALGFSQAGGTLVASTPVLDALAARSLELTHTWSVAPVTLPAHASLFTGNHPVAHGVHDNLGFQLPQSATTLAERLAREGVTTGAVFAAPVVGPQSGLAQGFETYQGPTFDSGLVERPARWVSEVALAMLDRMASVDGPFFLWAHYFDAHAPHEAGLGVARARRGGVASMEDDRAAYRLEIERIDRQLGRLLDGAFAAARARPLCIVVTADHGEALGDHGEATHGHLLHDSTMRVPLLIHHPRIPPGRCSQTSSLVDLLPTLLELFDLPKEEPLQGQSLVPWLLDQGARERPSPRIVCFETRLPWHEFGWAWLDGACDGRFKWVDRPSPEVFDLDLDPGESRAILEAQHALVDSLAGAVRQLQMKSASFAPAAGAGECSALTNLGYVAARRTAPENKEDLAEPEDRLALVGIRDRGLEALGRGDFAGALAEFGKLRLGNPDPAPASMLIAVTYSRHAESVAESAERMAVLEHAAAAWRDAVEICPADALRHYNLAMTLMDLGRPTQAIPELERCVELAPEDGKAREQLAHARRQQAPPSKDRR